MKPEKNREDKNVISDVIKMLVAIIEGKGAFINGHAERVAGNCVRFSRMLQLPKQAIDNIYLAALLHDIGMVYTPIDIIQKPGKLSGEEMEIIREHPLTAEKILSNVGIFRGIIPIIRYHHELFDGSGYPDGLKGNEIPLESRILCVVDSYEAMTAFRTYRPAMETGEAISELQEKAGKLFDLRVVTAFVNFLKATPSVSRGVKEEEQKMSIRETVVEIIQKFKKGEIDLPVLPRVVEEVEAVMKRVHSSTDELAAVIEKDAAISIKVIVVANSPLYRGAEKVQNVKHAIIRLGIKETRNIVLAIAHRGIYKTGKDPFTHVMEALWMHSLASAYGSKIVAQTHTSLDPDKLFLMGLIHDIGKALLIKVLTETYGGRTKINMTDIITSIQEVHASFSAALLERWDFSRDFIKVAEMHEGPRFFDTTRKEVLVVNLANNITRKIGFSLFTDETLNLAELDSARLLGLSAFRIDGLCEEVKEVMQTTVPLI